MTGHRLDPEEESTGWRGREGVSSPHWKFEGDCNTLVDWINVEAREGETQKGCEGDAHQDVEVVEQGDGDDH